MLSAKVRYCLYLQMGLLHDQHWGSEIYSQRGRQNLVHYSKGNSTNIANTILKYLGEVDNIVKVENPWIANL